MRLLPVLLTLLLSVGAASAADNAATGSRELLEKGSWHEGALGFNDALEEALADERPLAVYFYTDWCGYCRQLERELLYRPEVEEYLSHHVTRVRINPEKGRTEAAIAQRYGVFGYPSLFLHAGPGHEAQKLSGRVRRDGQWQMQTTEEFIEVLRGFVDRADSAQRGR